MKRGCSTGQIQEEQKVESFERRMKKLIDWERRKYQIRTGVRYMLSAAAVMLIILCLTNPGYIAKAWDVLVKWHKTHLEVDVPDTEWMGAVPEYELSYVPEGFELVMEDCDEIFGGDFWYKKEERDLFFSYSFSGGNHQYDNEHSEISMIQDKEGNDVLLVKFEDGGYSMLWQAKEGLTFSLDADVTEEELFKIKDGIQVKK
ncbi:DUF4367 domain-containing protein [Lachnospiraceae bacterium 38-10]